MNITIKKSLPLGILPILAGLLASLGVWTDKAGSVVTSVHTGWGDLLFHIRAAVFFAAQDGIPHESFFISGQPVGYAFLTDYISSLLMMIDVPLGLSFLIPTVILATVAVFLFEYMVLTFAKSHLVAILATILFFGFGSLGGFYTFPELFQGEASWQDNLRNLPHDVTFWPDQNLFIPNPFLIMLHQRAYLVGFPLLFTLIWLTWKALTKDDLNALIWTIPVGIGLAFVHPYTWGASLLLLPSWIAGMWLYKLRPFSQKDFIRFAGTFAVIAIGGYLMVKLLQPNAGTSIIKWHPGWLEPSLRWPLFWLKNIGLHLLLLPFAWKNLNKTNKPLAVLLLASIVPFIAANLFKFAPWEWDNTKVFTLVWIGVAIANAHLLATWLRRKDFYRALAVLALLTMVFTGGLEMLRAVVRYQEPYTLLSHEYILAGEELRSLTRTDDIIVSGVEASHPIFLISGRPSFLAYEGWLWSQGWVGQYEDRSRALPVLYAGDLASEEVIDMYDINLVVIGPEEIRNGANAQWFEDRYKKLPITHGQHTIYRVRP